MWKRIPSPLRGQPLVKTYPGLTHLLSSPLLSGFRPDPTAEQLLSRSPATSMLLNAPVSPQSSLAVSVTRPVGRPPGHMPPLPPGATLPWLSLSPSPQAPNLRGPQVRGTFLSTETHSLGELSQLYGFSLTCQGTTSEFDQLDLPKRV